jgi:starch synthase
MVSRLTEMKGFDIAEPVIRRLLAGEAQFVLLGTGQSQYQEMFRAIEAQYPTKAKAFFRYDDALARRIYAGSDIFLMPSRFEPCGQGQLIAMRYGSVPVVRATGGLADTVSNYDDGSGTGFLFEEYSPEAFWRALSRALELYVCDRKAWLGLQWRGMTQDLSWEASARKYEALYQKAIAISSRKG